MTVAETICFLRRKESTVSEKFIVRLSPEERQRLEELVHKGKSVAYRIKHANILLKADADGPAWCDQQIADAFGCHVNTVANVRRRCVDDGLEAALDRKKRATPPVEPILDGAAEARLITIACSEAPDGAARWTMQMLADELVRLKVVTSISDETVRRTLKKTNCDHIARKAG